MQDLGTLPGGTESWANGIADNTQTTQTVFLVHGIAQSGGDLNNLAATLRDPDYGIDQTRFTVDSAFDFGSCTNNVSCDSSLYTIQNGAKLLAQYINLKAAASLSFEQQSDSYC
jgi:hypothetical protein